jgi:hypothetical protein
VQTGRLYAESAAGYRTGLAISNPNASGVTLSFHFTDRNGQDFGHGTLALPAHGQIARFLNEDPFRLAASEETTFAFEASAPVAVLGLRGRDNERGEFLITTLPLSPEIAQPGQELYLPHFTYGGGWTTQVVLVNPGGRPVTGNLVFFDQGRADTPANPVSVLLNGAAGSSFRYELPPGATRTFSTSGEPKDLVVGSIRILPDPESATPRAMAVFSFRQNGITVTEAGVEAVIPGKSRTMYAEASGDFSSLTGNATTTGIAVANASDRLMTVQFRLRDFRGIDQRLGAIVLPARGQAALFMHQIPGLDQTETPFRGTIEITADSPYAAMTGLRGRRNERGDFLITSTPLFEKELSSFVRVFPHIADGGGYRTQLILLDWLSASAGSILFSDQSGAAWSVGIR